MTPEASAKKKIQSRLADLVANGLRHKLVWNAGASYGVARLDADGPVEGYAVAIEVKRFDGKGDLTTRQKIDLRDYRHAGAVTFLIDSDATMFAFLDWCIRVQREREAREQA